MKKTIIVIALFTCFLGLQAQTTEYKIDAYYVSHTTDTLDVVEPIDSIQFDTTFTYTLNILEISDNEKDTIIRKRGGLTAVALQSELYGLTEQAFNQSARQQASAIAGLRNRNVYLAALNQVNLNDYYADVRTRVRQQLNGNWILRLNGTRYICEVSDNTGALRTASSDVSGEATGTLIARIVPRSRLFLSLDVQAGFGSDVNVYSTDGRNYISDDFSAILRFR